MTVSVPLVRAGVASGPDHAGRILGPVRGDGPGDGDPRRVRAVVTARRDVVSGHRTASDLSRRRGPERRSSTPSGHRAWGGRAWGASTPSPAPTCPSGCCSGAPTRLRTGRRVGATPTKDSAITGFSLTHMSGPGCAVYGDIPILPTVGAIGTDPAASSSPFSHPTEEASPGNYAVTVGRPPGARRAGGDDEGGPGSVQLPRERAPPTCCSRWPTARRGRRRSAVTVVGERRGGRIGGERGLLWHVGRLPAVLRGPLRPPLPEFRDMARHDGDGPGRARAPGRSRGRT